MTKYYNISLLKSASKNSTLKCVSKYLQQFHLKGGFTTTKAVATANGCRKIPIWEGRVNLL